MANNIKYRRKILEKIAQAVPSTPTPPAAILPEPAFQISSVYPNIRTGFSPASIPVIDQLSSMLNTALHYATSGKINFQTLRNSNFNIDASALPSADQKNLVNFSKKLFINLINNGAAFTKPLSAIEIASISDNLLTSQELNNLSTLNPSGPIAQKIRGNLKTNIVNLLNYLKLVNPRQAS